MSQGRKRHQITIQQRATGFDAAGQASGAWSDLVTMLANVVFLSGRELELARQKVANASHRVEAYWYDGVNPKDRILFDGRYLYVSSIENVGERSVEMVLLCGEEVV